MPQDKKKKNNNGATPTAAESRQIRREQGVSKSSNFRISPSDYAAFKSGKAYGISNIPAPQPKKTITAPKPTPARPNTLYALKERGTGKTKLVTRSEMKKASTGSASAKFRVGPQGKLTSSGSNRQVKIGGVSPMFASKYGKNSYDPKTGTFK